MEKVIRWSSGTGDIGPTAFEVQGTCFWLELGISERFGRMEQHQAVVSVDGGSPTVCKQNEEKN